MDSLSDIERALLVQGTNRIFHLLGEISTKLSLLEAQAEVIHATLNGGSITVGDRENTEDADANQLAIEESDVRNHATV